MKETIRVLCVCSRIRLGKRDFLNPKQTMDRCIDCKAYSFLECLTGV